MVECSYFTLFTYLPIHIVGIEVDVNAVARIPQLYYYKVIRTQQPSPQGLAFASCCCSSSISSCCIVLFPLKVSSFSIVAIFLFSIHTWLAGSIRASYIDQSILALAVFDSLTTLTLCTRSCSKSGS